MSEHTPGPWTAHKPSWRRGGPPYKAAITAADGGTIANVLCWDAAKDPGGHWATGPTDDPSPDAHLIAAAPDLLAACMAALVPAGDTPEEIKAQLRIAVNKAMRPQPATEPNHDD